MTCKRYEKAEKLIHQKETRILSRYRRMPTRNRRGRSPTRYTDATNSYLRNHDDDDSFSDYDPLDEDDQRELLESLEQEAAAQSRLFQIAFGYGIGGTAVVFSLVFPLLCPEECGADTETAVACWSHSFFSCIVHARTVFPFVKPFSANQRRSTAITVLDAALQVIPVLLWWAGVVSSDEEYFHLALLISNFVTFLGARIIYWDMNATQIALESLDSARYRYKSL